MRSWVVYVAWSKDREHESEIDSYRKEIEHLKEVRKKREDALCRRVVMKLLHVKLGAAMNAWREFNRLKRLLERIGARWLRFTKVWIKENV